MVERLRTLKENADPRSTIFESDRLAELCRTSLPKATNSSQEFAVLFEYGKQLLQAGQSEDALKQFDLLEQRVTQAGGSITGRARVELRRRRAVAMLRLGEQENCLSNHNASSCLIPIQPAGFHHLPRGSRGAIALFSEQLAESPDDLSARWLLNLAYMTLGEYPDKVPGQWLVPPKVFDSEYTMPRFPDVAGALGLDVDNLAGGVIVDDFDNDGFLDVVVSAWGRNSQLRYFHNDGNGRFTERTAEAGLLGLTGGLNILQTDYNNDGLLDIWVMRGAWIGKAGRLPSSLLRNNGDGTFTDVTEEAGLLRFHPTQTSVWFDYDGDGWLDLFIGNETTDQKDPDPCELFHNNGDGTFTECASACGLAVKRFVKGVTWADYDNDGRPDLYLSCRDGANLLFHNDGPAPGAAPKSGKWQFTELAHHAGVTEPLMSFPTWFFDYDNDGWEDLFVCGYYIQNVGDIAADYLGMTNHGAYPKLYHNNRDGTFTDVTTNAHLNHLLLGMGCNFGDLDNDGWLDFYMGTGDPDFSTLIPKRMFRNAEGKFFQDVTTTTGTGHIQKGHGVAFADFDNDGNQDVYMVVGGAYTGDNYRNALFLNPGTTNHWAKFKLAGVRSNRAAIGARIKVTVETPAGPRSIYKTVNSGGSFGSSPLRQEIGLGNASRLTEVEVFWPTTGIRQRFDGLELDHAYFIREDQAKAEVIPLKRIHFDLQQQPVHNHLMQSRL